MPKRLLSVPTLAKRADTNIITVRTVIDNDLVVGFLLDNGHRAGDDTTVQQIKAHLANVKKK